MKEIKVKTDIDFRINSPALKTAIMVVLFLFLTFIVAYPVVVFSNVKSDVKTQTVVSRTVYSTIDAKAFAVRNETELFNTHPGTLVPTVMNGSKVAVNDTVAEVFSDDFAAEKAARLGELKSEIDYYLSIAGAGTGTLRTDIDFYKNSTRDTLMSIVGSAESDDLSDIYSLSRDMRDVTTKKQIATGTVIDVSGIISSLQAEYDALRSSAVPKASVTADRSGYYVSSCDGYEDNAVFTDVMNITPEKADSLVSEAPGNVASGSVGKLITDFNWYLVLNTEVKKLGNISKGSSVTVSFTNSSVDELKMRVVAINQSEEDGRVTLVLTSNIMNEDIAALRVASVKVRVEAFNGLVVERKALRTVDGQTGVYIKVGNLAQFRAVNIVYSDENIVIADNSKADISNHLEMYDEIILEGTDLYDKKLLD